MLTRRYVRGERAKFVSPMALFLFSVFLLFTVVANLPGGGGAHGIPASGAEMAREHAKAMARLESQRAAATTGEARDRIDDAIGGVTEQLSALVVAQATTTSTQVSEADAVDVAAHVRTGWHWLDGAIAHASANPALTLYKLKSHGYKYSWAVIPISLPFLWLLFCFRRDVGLYDHAIFAIYSLSLMSLGVVVLAVAGAIGLGGGLVALCAMLVPPLHMYRQLRAPIRSVASARSGERRRCSSSRS